MLKHMKDWVDNFVNPIFFNTFASKTKKNNSRN